MSGTLVGSFPWSSPEVILEMPWNTAADIWSFGAVVRAYSLASLFKSIMICANTGCPKLISLIYGEGFNIFLPKDLDQDHDKFLLNVLKEQFRYFGPFPAKFGDIASEGAINSILYLMQEIPMEKLIPFSRVTEREVIKKDKEFIGKIMMLDWRDRPTAKDLLEDEWWQDVQ